MNLLKGMFADLRQTRFHNTVEFYSLFMLVWEMNRENLILRDKKRNRVAMALLKKLSTGVDELRDQLRRAWSSGAPRPPDPPHTRFMRPSWQMAQALRARPELSY